MRLESLELRDFRNYRAQSVEFDPDCNVIFGENAQGQTRTAALALKLAEREIYQNAAGEWPVLLLDDVLSELDPRRQEFVLNRIAGGQVFITCCEDDRLPQLLGGKVFHVQNGTIG